MRLDRTYLRGCSVTPSVRSRWEQGLRSCPDATRSRLAVLLILGTYANADGTSARPGLATLAEDCGVSVTVAQRAIRWALSEGWLTQVRRGHRRGDGSTTASEYRLTIPANAQQVAGDRLSAQVNRSPATDREISTGHSDDLNRSLSTSQQVTSDHLPRSDHEKTTRPDPVRDAIAILANDRGWRSITAARRQFETEGLIAELETIAERFAETFAAVRGRPMTGRVLLDLHDKGPLYAELVKAQERAA